jgi:hypothetical protein
MLRTVGIAAAILAAVAASPKRAEASCGNYVHIAAPGEEDSAPAPMPKPCDGPNCSSRQTPPVSPLSAPVVEWDASKSVARLAGEVVPANESKTYRAARSTLLLPDPVRSSIFHPPRAV